MPPHRPSHVVIRLPEWLWGDNPAAFGVIARWAMAPVEGDSGAWEVSLMERASGQPAGLVQLHRVAGASNLANLLQNPNSRPWWPSPSPPPCLG
jgi:hypothetical protein